mmetsp:Transcript_8720/g.11324  ORF Transcript_8720/g.11324 Transcript_8720/m.11324 type:complete len:550 (+) Transcript_8720:113-1762(+)
MWGKKSAAVANFVSSSHFRHKEKLEEKGKNEISSCEGKDKSKAQQEDINEWIEEAKRYLIHGSESFKLILSAKGNITAAICLWEKSLQRPLPPTEYGIVFSAHKNIGLALLQHEKKTDEARSHLVAATNALVEMKQQQVCDLEVLLKDGKISAIIGMLLKSLKECEKPGDPKAISSAECYREVASALDGLCRVIGEVAELSRLIFCRDCLEMFTLEKNDTLQENSYGSLWYCAPCSEAFEKKMKQKRSLKDGTPCADCGNKKVEVILDGDGEYYCEACTGAYRRASKQTYTKEELLALRPSSDPEEGAVEEIRESYGKMLQEDDDEEDFTNALTVSKKVYSKAELLKLRPELPKPTTKAVEPEPEPRETYQKSDDIDDAMEDIVKFVYTKQQLLEIKDSMTLIDTRKELDGKEPHIKTQYTKQELLEVREEMREELGLPPRPAAEEMNVQDNAQAKKPHAEFAFQKEEEESTLVKGFKTLFGGETGARKSEQGQQQRRRINSQNHEDSTRLKSNHRPKNEFAFQKETEHNPFLNSLEEFKKNFKDMTMS